MILNSGSEFRTVLADRRPTPEIGPVPPWLVVG